MPHIALPEGLPGIRGAMAFRPETAKPLNELVEVLLRGPTLCPGERELIATYVSSLNDCYFCQSIHGAMAAAHLGGDEELVRRVKRIPARGHLGETQGAAGDCRQGAAGREEGDGRRCEHARSLGATDVEIHDTVLIAAAFCMYNRYVDGLATWQPTTRQCTGTRQKGSARRIRRGKQRLSAGGSRRSLRSKDAAHRIAEGLPGISAALLFVRKQRSPCASWLTFCCTSRTA